MQTQPFRFSQHVTDFQASSNHLSILCSRKADGNSTALLSIFILWFALQSKSSGNGNWNNARTKKITRRQPYGKWSEALMSVGGRGNTRIVASRFAGTCAVLLTCSQAMGFDEAPSQRAVGRLPVQCCACCGSVWGEWNGCICSSTFVCARGDSRIIGMSGLLLDSTPSVDSPRTIHHNTITRNSHAWEHL